MSVVFSSSGRLIMGHLTLLHVEKAAESSQGGHATSARLSLFHNSAGRSMGLESMGWLSAVRATSMLRRGAAVRAVRR